MIILDAASIDGIRKRLPAGFTATVKHDRLSLSTRYDDKTWTAELDLKYFDDEYVFVVHLEHAIRICHRFAERGPE